MNNVTKGLAYLLVIFLLLTGAGFMYHKQMPTPTPTPTPTPEPTPTPTPEPTPGIETEETAFITQSSNIHHYALEQFTADAEQAVLTEITYCNVEGCEHTLPQTYQGYSYSATVKEGKVLKLYVTNGVYQYVYVGEGLETGMITNPSKISDIDPSEVITITANM